MDKNRVVSIFDPATFQLEWKDIPGYSTYEASNLGIVRHKRLGKICNFSFHETSVGSYLRIGLLDDARTSRSKGAHILICTAFNGVSPGDEFEVNHIDGNKHNNLPSNLEWKTRGGNISHAYSSGLRRDNRKIEMLDTLSNTVRLFTTMRELQSFFSHSSYSMTWNMVRDHSTKPYLGRYLFKIDKQHTIASNKDNVKTIYVLNYRDNELHVFDNLGDLEINLGIKRNTVYYHLVRNSKELLNGYVFSYSGDPSNFPKYSRDEVTASLTRSSNGKGSALRVTNMIENTIKVYSSIPDFARDVGIKHSNTVRRAIFEKNGILDNYRIELITSSSNA